MAWKVCAIRRAEVKIAPLTFHIGLHKTASSLLQSSVFPRLNGIAYFDAGRPFFEFVRSVDADVPTIVSHESLSSDLLARDYCRQRIRSIENLSRHFPDARVLLVVREPSAWLASVYREHLHQGGSLSFDAFAQPLLDDGTLDLYALLLAVRRLPFEQLLVLDFDELIQDLEGAVRRIRRLAGVPGDQPDSWPVARVNGGVRNLGARVLRRANPFMRSRFQRRGLPLNSPLAKRFVSTPRHWIQRGALRFLNDIGTDVVAPSALAGIERQWAHNWAAARADFVNEIFSRCNSMR